MNKLKQTYNRTKQTVEEKFGDASHTEYEAEFQAILNKGSFGDDIKTWTAKILGVMEIYLQPDPAIRIMPGLTQEGLNKPENLGADMGSLAGKLGNETGYGAALQAGSDAFSKIGAFERVMVTQSNQQYVIPVKRFLNEDMKEFDTQRKVLNNLRLDMDSLKTKAVKNPGNAAMQEDLEKSEKAFKEQEAKGLHKLDEQFVKHEVRELIKKAEDYLPELQKHLKQFVDVRLEFLKKSTEALEELDKKLQPSLVNEIVDGVKGMAAKIS